MKTNTIAALVCAATNCLAQPVITRQPANLSVSLGAGVLFQVTASSTNAAPMAYQWRFNNLETLYATNRTLAFANAQLTNAGAYQVVVSNISGSITSQVAHLEVDPTFFKVTTGAIVTDPGAYLACAWGDYDNDGFPDLVVTCANSSAPQRNILFHNNRDGTFNKVTNTAVSLEARDWRGCAWADYDNDGNLDLFVVSDNSRGFPSQNELFRNNGDGTFTKMTAASVGAIVPGGGNSDGPAWGDYDRDGFLDLFVATFDTDLMFHNNGDGSYSNVTSNIGIPLSNQGGYRAMWGDYDNDSWPDLLVQVSDPTVTPGASVAYHALGGGLFTNFVSGLQRNYQNAGSSVWADYDNDGYPDMVVPRFGGLPNLVYHNNGDGSFALMTTNQVGSIAGDLLDAYQCAWGDYDNDGFLDVFLLRQTSGILYHNNGAGVFTRVVSGSPVNDLLNGSVSATWVDYDNDGFLDLFVPNNGGGSISTNLLYRNSGNSNAWLKVKLVGTASNRSAIGAKVRVQATIRGKSMWQVREINTGDGFSGGPLEAHFGLGDATNIDQVRIEWPSGIVQTTNNVAPRQFFTVVEHQDTPIRISSPRFTSVSHSTNGVVTLAVTGDPGLLYVFDASTNLVNWTKIVVRSNATGVINFTDTKTKNYAKRFYRVSIP